MNKKPLRDIPDRTFSGYHNHLKREWIPKTEPVKPHEERVTKLVGGELTGYKVKEIVEKMK